MTTLKNLFILLQLFIFTSLSIAQSNINVENIEIIRDEMGVPHIFSETNAEAVYGIAWAQCEDNFTFMQQNFALTKNLAGRVMGKDGAVLDYLFQVFQIDDFVNSRYEKDITPEMEEIISAYVAALNRYAELHPDKVLHKDIFPLSNKNIIANYTFHFNTNHSVAMELGKFMSDDFTYTNFGQGSNAFAYNSNKTSDGKSYLIGNPHQPVNTMGNWWEVSVHSKEGYEFFGACFSVGGISPTIGSNRNLGWTHTTNYPNGVDIYKLQMHPDNDNLYLYNGIWEEVETKKAKLKVKIGPITIPVTKKYYLSQFGLTIEKEDGFYALKNNVHHNIKFIEQWYKMGLAKNFEEFRAALDLQGIPSQTITYADKDDNIYHISNTIQPYRAQNFDWSKTSKGGTDVIPGYAKYNWSLDSIYPVSASPQIKNPNAGYLYDCNNTVFRMTEESENLKTSNFPRSFGLPESNTVRANTYESLIKNYNKISFEEARALRESVVVDKNKLSFKNCTNCNDVYAIMSKYEKLAPAKLIFEKWNGSFDIHNKEASLMALAIMNMETYIVEQIGNEELPVPEQVMYQCILDAQKFLMKKYGSLEIPLGDIQKAVRGDVELPMYGAPNTLANAHFDKYGKKKIQLRMGDSFIFYAKYGKNGLEQLETINAFGNSTEKDNPHYTDQTEMYVNMKTKTAILNLEKLKQTGVVYHPN